MTTLPSFRLPQQLQSSTGTLSSGWAPTTELTSFFTLGDATNNKQSSDEHKEQLTNNYEQSGTQQQQSIDILSMFAPFNKSDRLGKISDFTQSNEYYQNRQRQSQQRDGSVVGSSIHDSNDITFSYRQDRVDDNSFTLVDSRTAVSSTNNNKNKYNQSNRNQRGGIIGQPPRVPGVANNFQSQQRTGAMSSVQQQRALQATQQTNKASTTKAWGNTQGSNTSGNNLISRASTGFGTQTTTARSGTINVSARQVAVQQRQATYANYRRRGYNNQQQVDEIDKPQSIDIQPNYTLLNEITINELNNSLSECSSVKDITTAGVLKSYNTTYNRVTPRNPITLNQYDRKQFFTATTSEDTILTNLMKQSNNNKCTVYATDSIISILMSANKTVQPWDIIIRKFNNVIVLDKRSTSKIDYITVGENVIYDSNDTNKITDIDNMNHFDNLSIEATIINQNFSQQILNNKSDDSKLELDQPNPFIDSLQDEYEAASVGYKYRSFTLNGFDLVVRCSINAYVDQSGTTQYVISRALNEYDSKHSGTIDYRQRLESQTGAILASEMKNNMNKLTRWTAEAVLCGVEHVRLGFVSRLNNKSNYKHQILMTKLYTPSTFADSLSIKVRALWGSLNTIIKQIQSYDNGTYLLLRDANKPVLKLYSVPENTFADELSDISQYINTSTESHNDDTQTEETQE